MQDSTRGLNLNPFNQAQFDTQEGRITGKGIQIGRQSLCQKIQMGFKNKLETRDKGTRDK